MVSIPRFLGMRNSLRPFSDTSDRPEWPNCHFLAIFGHFGQSRWSNMSVCQYVSMQLFSLGIKMKVVQNVIRMSDSHYVNMSIRQYVNMSICDFSAQVSKSKLFGMSSGCQTIIMSVCQYVNRSICQYVNMSEFQLRYQNESCS